MNKEESKQPRIFRNSQPRESLSLIKTTKAHFMPIISWFGHIFAEKLWSAKMMREMSMHTINQRRVYCSRISNSLPPSEGKAVYLLEFP